MCGEQFLSDSVHDYAGSLPVLVASAPGERGEVKVEMSCGAVAPLNWGLRRPLWCLWKGLPSGTSEGTGCKGCPDPSVTRGHPSPHRPIRPALIVPLVHSAVSSQAPWLGWQTSIVQDEGFLSGVLTWDHPWQLS